MVPEQLRKKRQAGHRKRGAEAQPRAGCPGRGRPGGPAGGEGDAVEEQVWEGEDSPSPGEAGFCLLQIREETPPFPFLRAFSLENLSFLSLSFPKVCKSFQKLNIPIS